MSSTVSLSDRLNALKLARLPEGDFSVKLIILGDGSVGKTSVTLRYVENRFQANYITTLGVNILRKTQNLGKTTLKWLIWDLGGQDAYENYRKRFYGGAAAAVLVFDVTNPTSFVNLEAKWIKEIESVKINPRKLPVVVVANKIDLVDEIKVPTANVSAFAKKYNFDFVETSAKTGANIEDAFQLLAYKYLQSV